MISVRIFKEKHYYFIIRDANRRCFKIISFDGFHDEIFFTYCAFLREPFWRPCFRLRLGEHKEGLIGELWRRCACFGFPDESCVRFEV